ncbi:MAG: hypothetical protein Q7R41_18230 [Phycisphaerales bacterium]|nr:hypothetical protein [Phycisphaerales bacterium]
MKLNRRHTTLRKDFRALPEPESLELLEGALTAEYVGPAPVRLGGPAFMTLMGFRGWKGKRFARDGDLLKGMNSFGDGDVPSDRIPMEATIAPSVTDGRRALVVTYPAGIRRPWRSARDEFREMEDGRLLGTTVFELPLVRHLPLAFVLARD